MNVKTGRDFDKFLDLHPVYDRSTGSLAINDAVEIELQRMMHERI